MNRKVEVDESEAYNITIQGRHMEITDAIRNYALEKFAKVERFSHRLIDVHVVMEIQRQVQKVTIIMHFDHTTIKVEASSDSMYATIDKAIDRLRRQIRKYKDRLQDLHRKGAAAVPMNVEVFGEASHTEEEDVNEEIELENKRLETVRLSLPQIVNRETLPLKTLTREEALIKMDLSGDFFMVFRAEEDHKIKVIYRRDDNNFGIIEPE